MVSEILALYFTNRILTNSEDPVKMFEHMASDQGLQLSVAIRAVLSKTIITIKLWPENVFLLNLCVSGQFHASFLTYKMQFIITLKQ